MKTIWKYDLDDVPGLVQRVEMPAGAEVIAVGLQDGGKQIVAWAIVDTDAYPVAHIFQVTFTGWGIPTSVGDFQRHLGSLVMIDGIVVHVFYEGPCWS